PARLLRRGERLAHADSPRRAVSPQPQRRQLLAAGRPARALERRAARAPGMGARRAPPCDPPGGVPPGPGRRGASPPRAAGDAGQADPPPRALSAAGHPFVSGGAMSAGPVNLYDNVYADFASEAERAVRREAYGEDLGQSSWLTAREWLEFADLLGIREDTE